MRQLLVLLVVFFVYSAVTVNEHLCILYAYPDGWSDDILINADTLAVEEYPDIGIDSKNNVWITWDDNSLISGEIYYSKRDSLGNCLIPETNLSGNASISHFSRIACDQSDNIQFIWRDASPIGEGVWHAKLANNGSVIVAPHLAVSGGGGYFSTLLPAMVLDKYKNINIIWDEDSAGNNKMCFSKLDSVGMPIIEKLSISPDIFDAYWPGIGVDSMANCHLGYRTDSAGGNYWNWLTYSKVDKDGTIIIANKILGYGLLPAIIADYYQNIHIVYTNSRGPGTTIEYLKLDQDGNILIGPDTINSPYLYNTYGHMAMDSLHYLHVVWVAFEVAGFDRIMYAKLDTLANYVIPPMSIVHRPYAVIPSAPRIAVDRSNRLHVTWMDQRLNPGITDDIFYKRGENEQCISDTVINRYDQSFSLSVSPNPFTDWTLIAVSLSDGNEIGKLEIYNAVGQLVNEYKLAGQHESVVWRGVDKKGIQLPAGVYFVYVKNNKGRSKCMTVKLK